MELKVRDGIREPIKLMRKEKNEESRRQSREKKGVTKYLTYNRAHSLMWNNTIAFVWWWCIDGWNTFPTGYVVNCRCGNDNSCLNLYD